jgi:hypothetical protein
MKGSSRYPEPFRELLAGAKQQGNGIELAPELPSEIRVGQDESPSLSGQDIGRTHLYLEKEWLIDPSSLLAKVFL